MQTTKKQSRLLRIAIAACVALFVIPALATPALGDDGGRDRSRPKPFYLSVGDSMAFGIQLDRLDAMIAAGTYRPGRFDTGYTDRLAARMERLRAEQQTVNLSCPGEDTDTMIHGGCGFTQPEPDGPGLTLHTNYTGSQLDAAVSFLRSHREQVGPITISIGGNDAVNLIADGCNFDEACVEASGIRHHLGQNLDHILGALRDAAPEAEIVLVVFYNPFSIDVPGSDALWRNAYAIPEKNAARRNGVRVADVTEVINGRNLCAMTFLCRSGDLHPTDAGYRRIGDLIYRVAGFRPGAG
jgi:lysophospholipase L1-like esterase